jgi:hypothetical protein
MGLTIHYSLTSSTRSTKQVHTVVEQLRQRALDLPFQSVSELVELGGEDCNWDALDYNDPNRWLLIQASRFVSRGDHSYSVALKHVVAFTAFPGDGCEPLNLGLCLFPGTIQIETPKGLKRIRTNISGWSWSSFCKTQYASDPRCGGVENFLRCHLSVIRLLDHAQELGILDHAEDEGEYWEKRDIKALVAEVGSWNSMMASIVGRLKDELGGDFVAPITDFPNFEHLEADGQIAD